MSHSPGPWEVHGDTTSQEFYVHGANRVCDIRRGGSYSPWCDSRFSRTPREDEANAHLIAAAPDLLEVCEEMLGDMELCCEGAGESWRNRIRKARAATKKAKGEK